MIQRGEIWWTTLDEPAASRPGYHRPVLVVQADTFNKSLIPTVIVAVITTNLRLAPAPGNVPLTRRQSGLPKDSVVNVSQVLTVDRAFLTERVAQLSPRKWLEVDAGLLRVLGLGPPDGPLRPS